MAKFLVAAAKILFVVPNFVAVTKPFFSVWENEALGWPYCWSLIMRFLLLSIFCRKTERNNCGDNLSVQWVTKFMTPASMHFLWKKGSWLLWPTVHNRKNTSLHWVDYTITVKPNLCSGLTQIWFGNGGKTGEERYLAIFQDTFINKDINWDLSTIPFVIDMVVNGSLHSALE